MSARRNGRSVPALYGVLSLVLVAGALTFALSSPPPSTPPLAEVAPAPQENIEVERVEQSSRFGEGGQGGEGECVAGDPGCEGGAQQAEPDASSGTPPATGDEAVDSSKERGCYIDESGRARQTEDPQSPPCKREIFTGDNGGATAPGVTAQEIRIAVPWTSEEQKTGHVLDPLLAHFNENYEFHGRRLVAVRVPVARSTDPAEQRAIAQQVLTEAQPFASLEYRLFGPYNDELARAGVISLVTAPLQSEEAIGALHPYVWSVDPSLEESLDASGRVICESLAGRPARFGGEDVRASTRRFGVVADRPGRNGVDYDPSVLVSRLAACGADHRVYEPAHERTDPAALMQRLRSDGITTVVCLCASFGDALSDAEAAGYRPEWFFPAGDDNVIFLKDVAYGADKYPREQMKHVFGLSGRLRRPVRDAVNQRDAFAEQFWFHAVREQDPSFRDGSGFVARRYYSWYAQLLVLASGIQWAGPNLTPESFAEALQGLRFPNPDVGQAPWFQPSVGFGPGDHSLTNDFALLWWQDPTDEAYQSKTDFGRLCYVGAGVRYRGTFPPNADELFFSPEAGCR